MDPSQLVKNQAQSQHQSQHQLQQTAPSVQLPDESYIEKLFPKCQPKAAKSQMRGTSYSGNRRMARLDERQQQAQRRQSRNKHQQQYLRRERSNDQMPNGQIVATSSNSGSNHNNIPNNNNNNNNNNNINNNNNNINNNNIDNSDRNRTNAKATQSQYYYSSNSSDDEDKNNGGKTLNSIHGGGIRRSGSNQFSFDSTNKMQNSEQQQQQPDNNYSSLSAKTTSSYSKPRTKKYRASKNLQQQLSRSQSSHSKLSNSFQVPITRSVDPIDAENNFNSTVISNQQLDSGESSKKRDRDEPTRPDLSVASVNESAIVSKQSAGRGSRTCRGIVFSEPLTVNVVPGESETATKGILSEHLTDLACDIVGDPYATVNQASSSASKSRPQPRQQLQQQQQQSLQVQQEQAHVTERGTADVKLIQDCSDNYNSEQVDSLAGSIESSSINTPNNQESDLIVKSSSSTIIQTNGVEHNQALDEDKFINLFVYDQPATTHKFEDSSKQLEAALLLGTSPDQDNNLEQYTDTKINRNNQASHSLLTTDLGDNEQGVISNDTSTEELCSFGDNDTDISLRQKLLLAKQSLENEQLPSCETNHHEKPQQDFNLLSNSNKSILKQHRSIGTLQTVDEKAESNIEDDDHAADNSQTELIDISETSTMVPAQEQESNNVIRKGFVPPGFPQRVRSAVKAPEPEVAARPLAPCLDSSPVHVPQPSTSSGESTKRPSLTDDDKPQGNLKSPEKLSGGLIGDTNRGDYEDEFSIATESQSVVEKNLSEALNRVSLDQMIAQDLKDAHTTNLRHHKLPNESSHFSAIRSPLAVKASELSTIRSSVHFNTLSDGESGQEDNIVSDLSVPVKTKSILTTSSKGLLKRQDTPMTSNRSSFPISKSSPRVDEEPHTTAKTALVFPRLDEGLSSEAESCDEEAEEDDDKAMDADVDADDDDDEDDADEDAESPVQTIDRRQSAIQTSVDSFFRHQQQSLKPTNRSIGSLQQLSTNVNNHSSESDMHHAKLQNQAYNNFNVNDDQINQRTESKSSIATHTGQNGIQSNYWMGAIANQQATMSSQPTPSPSQFTTIQRNQLSNSNNVSNSNSGNVNLSRSNSYGNRDDAKAANRLSSDTDNETDRLLGTQRNDQLQKLAGSELASNNQSAEHQTTNNFSGKQGTNSREVLIEGVLFNVKYLGSTHTECEGRGEKEDRIHQAELAVHEVKFRNGELQSSVEVQLFISTEKIMVLDDKKKVIMMDHSLRTISYIADIGDAIVLIVRKKSSSLDAASDLGRPMSKTSCHVFESNESHTITKSISQAFQVAYTELLKANGGSSDANNYLPKELDYQEVLNSQEMSMTELEMFAHKDNQREVIVPKQVGEILGLSIVESGWGSVLPTAVIASLKQDGPAYRCKKLSVGDQILSINGISLVGLSLAECQKILRKTKTQSVARLSVVPCPITVEVKIKRPDTKYQLGFSVQHGVICSLLRGGIAERGGVRVGHRIISINGTTVVGVPHDKIVTLLASSVGEIRMKTCLTSLYRHMLGEEKKHQWV